MSAKTTAQILAEAAEIVRRGWCQDRYRDGERRCVLRAIFDASKCMNTDHFDANCTASEVCRTHASLPGCLVGFNDSPTTTQEDVAALLDLAALAAACPEVLDVG